LGRSRAVLVALVCAAGVAPTLVPGTQPAAAASACPRVPLPVALRQADSVWVAAVLAARPASSPPSGAWTLYVEVDSILKGPELSEVPPKLISANLGTGRLTDQQVKNVQKRLEGKRFLFAVTAEGNRYSNIGCGDPLLSDPYAGQAIMILRTRARAPLAPHRSGGSLVVTILLGLVIAAAAVALGRRLLSIQGSGGGIKGWLRGRRASP
jgi:hypothetical protein